MTNPKQIPLRMNPLKSVGTTGLGTPLEISHIIGTFLNITYIIKIRKSNASNLNNLKDKLKRDWSDVTNEKNPETAFNKFSDFIDATYEECFRIKTVKCRKD